VSSRAIRRGEPVTICYQTVHATAVFLQPAGLRLPAAGASPQCYRFYPARTAKYVLVAVSPHGRGETSDFVIEVK
jgi:hypothetical protein